MVAIVSGNSLGLELTSLGTLGSQGLWGSAGQGNSGEQVYVNAATGNLVVQRRDEFLASHGLDNAAVRTYNSLGQLTSDDNDGDNWTLGVYSQQLLLSGTVNTVGSTLTRTGRDGSAALYTWDASRSCYVTTSGGGAHDTITYNTSNQQYLRTDGSNREVEKYASPGVGKPVRLVSITDADGNISSYTYNATSGRLTSVKDKSGETITYTYDQNGNGTKLLSISTTDASLVTRSCITYTYDTNSPVNRLKTVTVDLTPENSTDSVVYKTTYTYVGTTNRLSTLTQDDGTKLTFTYTQDGTNRIATIAEGLNPATSYVYTSATRTTVTDPMGKVWLYDYDAAGQLTKLTSPAISGTSITQSYAYDTSGNVTSTTNGDGEIVTMAYDANGNQTKVTDHLGNTVTRTYNAANQLLTETASTLSTPDLVNAAGMSVSGGDITKTGGVDATWDSSAYSSIGYVGEASLEFTATQANKTLMVGLNTDPATNNTWTSLDFAFYLRSNGALEIREGSDGVNKAPGLTYAANDVFRISYDGTAVRYFKNGVEVRNYQTAITSPLYADSSFYSTGAKISNLRFSDRGKPELTTRYVYSATKPAQLRYAITPEGRVTQYEYNSYGERSAEIHYPRTIYDVSALADNAVPTEAQMNAWVSAITDKSNTARKEFNYDARGLLSEVVEYETVTSGGVGTSGHSTQYVYDQAGRLLQTIQSGGTSGDETGSPTTTYTYDGLGRVLTVTDPHGAKTSTVYTYDNNAQSYVVTTTQLQTNASTTSSYDKAGRLTGVTRTGGASTSYFYDKAGRLLMAQDADGIRAFNLYDEAGRLTGTVDADGTLTETSYDKAGRIIRVATYGVAVDLTKLVDGAGAPKIPYPLVADVRPVTSTIIYHWNFYDDAGRLTYEVEDNGAVTRHEYDGAGRLERTVRLSVAISTGGMTFASITAWLSDAGTLAGAAQDRSERLFYDADGLLVGTLDAEGYFTRHIYDKAGHKIQTRRYANTVPAEERAGGGSLAQVTPVADSVKDQVETFFYDARGLLTAQVDAGRYLTVNTYDNRGLLSTQTRYATALAATPVWTDSVATLITNVGTTLDDRTTSWFYTLDGQILKTINFEGTSSFNEYDSAGRLIKTTQGYGRSDKRATEFRYDTWGRKTAELDGEGSAKIAVDATQAQIDAIWTSDAQDYAYDNAGRLISTTDANNFKTLYFYDVDGRLTHTVNARGEVQEDRYNALGQRVATTRYAGKISLTSLSGGLVNSTLTTRIGTIADAAKDSTVKYAYNSAGRLYSTTSAVGAISYSSYNTFGELSEQKSAWQGGDLLNTDLRVDQFSYDRRGMLLGSVQDVGGIEASASTEYDAFGRVTKSTNANSKSQTFAYDKLGRMVTTTDPLTKSVTTTYDAFGQVLTVKDQIGQTTGKVTTYTYDKAARSVTMVTPEGVTVVTTRNAYGQTYAVKVGDNVNSYYSYDRDGNLTKTQLGATTTGTRAYDAGGRLISSTELGGALTTYVYDDVNHTLTRTVEPTDADTDIELNQTTTWTYDAKGQTISVKDARNTVTNYEFDLDGHQIKQIVDPTGLALTTDWTYDAEGRVLTVVDANRVTTQYTYDKLGRRKTEVVDTGAGHLNLTRTYDDYDDAGNLLKATDANGNVTRYRYDDAGRLEYTADAEGSVTRNQYDARGKLNSVTRYLDTVGVSEEPGQVNPDVSDKDQVTRYYYDDDGRLEYTIDATGAVSQTVYDVRGNVSQVIRYADVVDSGETYTNVAPDPDRDRIERFAYDAFNRQTWHSDAIGAFTQTEYDTAGNVSRVTRYFVAKLGLQPNLANCDPDPDRDRITNFEYDAAHRLTKSTDALGNTEKFTYDGNGNKLTFEDKNRAVWTYVYDKANRLTQQTSPAVDVYTIVGGNGVAMSTTPSLGAQLITKMTYDAVGNLKTRTEAYNRPEARTTSYDYDKANRQIKVTYPTINVYGDETAAQLAANGLTGNATRVETLGFVPTIQTWYDAAGNAVATTDLAGNISYKAYDKVGRVRFEVDALGYVTGYQRNSFGQAEVVTRYGKAQEAFKGISGANAARDVSADKVALAVNANGVDHTTDRTITTVFDKASRATRVTEGASYTFDSFANANQAYDASGGKSTVHLYNAFGEEIRTGQLVNRLSGKWQYSYLYYDQGGRRTAMVDAAKFLTTYGYDSQGNLTRQDEFFKEVSGTVDTSTPPDAAPDAAGRDRATKWDYDLLNRVKSETKVGVEYFDAANATTTSASNVATKVDVTTTYGYDGLGHQTWVKDGLGKYTYTYYDALGRIEAIAAPSRTGTVDGLAAVSLTPLVQFQRDAFGNVLARIDRALSATGVTSAGYTAQVDATNDRSTYTAYDAANHALEVQDAIGYHHYSSYANNGQLAKSWQTVTDNDGNKTTLYAAYVYDELGRLEQSLAPSPQTGQSLSMTTDYEYNAFGEVIKKGRDGLMKEYFNYDNAGKLVRTNSNGGVDTVYLYDLLGNQTAEIRSSGRDNTNVVTSTTVIATAAAWTDTRRVNTKYNALGQVVEREEASRITREGGLTVRAATASTTIISRPQPDQFGNINPGGSVMVSLHWNSLAQLGSGEVKVELTYEGYDGAGEPGGVSQTVTQIADASAADLGYTMRWTDSWGIGLSSVTGMRVWKKDINGEWALLIDRNTMAGRPFGTFGTQVEIAAPADPSTQVTFKYKRSGTSDAYTPVLDAALVKFGDSYWFNANGLATGSYDYEVWFTEHHLSVDNNQNGNAGDSGELMQSESYDVARRTETGSFTTKPTETDGSTPTENSESPTVTYLNDRWGNVLEDNDPRHSTWKTVRTYNLYNQLTSEKRPDAIYGNQGTTSPLRQFFYDKIGRQVAVLEERDATTRYVNRTEYDGAGQVAKEIHADGGVVTYLYDAFGQKRQMVDALGNETASAETKTNHTTLYTFDKLGHLRITQHGTTAAGAVASWYQNDQDDSDWDIAGGTRSNLTESSLYDEAGRKKSQTNSASETTRYWYDRAGNVVKTTLPDATISSTVTYTVNTSLGRVEKTETDANNNPVKTKTTTDYFGRTVAHTDLGGHTYTYAYADALGAGDQLVRQTNSLGQDLNYSYDGAGQLVGIYDASLKQTTTYSYDLAGHRVRELVQHSISDYAVETLQDNHLAYDTLGRLIYVADNRVQMTFAYDKASNRTRVQSHVLVDKVSNDDQETPFDNDRYFAYDAMNRQTLVDGTSTGGITTTQGHIVGYDKNGNRTSDTFYGNSVDIGNSTSYYNEYASDTTYTTTTYTTHKNSQVVQRHDYDAMGRLIATTRDGMVVDRRFYDRAGRVVESGPDGVPLTYAQALNDGVAIDDQIGLEVRRSVYNNRGQLLKQRTSVSGGGLKNTVYYTGTGYDGTTLGYDAVGNVQAYEVKVHGSYRSVSKVTTERYEGYVEKSTSTTSDDNGPDDGSSTNTYDVNGFLIDVHDATAPSLNRSIANDATGKALRVTQNGNKLYSLMVNGELLGQHGVGVDDVDPRTDKNAARFEQKADFDFGFRSVSGNYPSPTSGSYTVHAGDSLSAIAFAAYGDSSQWWRIAQANGLQGDNDLRAGQTLSLPAAMAGTNNNAGTFNPYNQADVIGDTTPNLPIPKVDGGRCADLSMVIGIVVAVVVAVLVTACSWGTAAGVAPAIGAAAGDTARQYSYAAFNGQLDMADMRTGGLNRDPRKMINPIYSAKHPAGFTKNEYDYKATAISAAAAYAGAVAGAAGGATGALARAAASYGTSAFLNAAAGRETNMSLTTFAASMAAAYASYQVGELVGQAQYGTDGGWDVLQAAVADRIPEANIGNQISRSLASGISGDVAAMVVDPKHRNAQSVWATIAGSLAQGAMDARALGSLRTYDTNGMEVQPSNMEPIEVLQPIDDVQLADMPDTSGLSGPGFHSGRITGSVSRMMDGDKGLIGEFARLNPGVDVDNTRDDRDYRLPTRVDDIDAARKSFQAVARGWQQKAEAARLESALDIDDVGMCMRPQEAAPMGSPERFKSMSDAELHAAGYQTIGIYDASADQAMAQSLAKTRQNLSYWVGGPVMTGWAATAEYFGAPPEVREGLMEAQTGLALSLAGGRSLSRDVWEGVNFNPTTTTGAYPQPGLGRLALPEGVSKEKLADFSQRLRAVMDSEGLPPGETKIQGSRVHGRSLAGESDIDVLHVVSDADFDAFVARRISETTGKSQRQIEKYATEQARVTGRGVSRTFETNLWTNVYPALPQNDVSGIQFSIIKESSQFNTTVFVPVR